MRRVLAVVFIIFAFVMLYGQTDFFMYEYSAVVYRDSLLQVAQKGKVKAQYELGLCYYFGKGTNENFTEAFNWYL